MAPQILEGSLALVRAQANVENGEVGVVMVNDEDAATMKRVYHIGNKNIQLKADNPQHPHPIILKATGVSIVGKVIGAWVDVK